MAGIKILTQLGQIPNQYAATIEVYQIRFLQIIEHRSDRLPRCPGNVRNVLLRQAVFDQHLIPNALPLLDCRIAQKIDDPLAGVFEDH